MGSRSNRRWVAGMTAAGVALALALAGCTGDGGDDSGAVSTGVATDTGGEAAPGGNEAPAVDGAAGEAGAGQPPVENKGAPIRLELDERSIVYTGSITVRVKDPEDAARDAIDLAIGAGGFVGSDRRTRDDSRSEATLELRVPSNRFMATLDELAGLGDEKSRDIDTDDVTEEVVDLDARIASQQASVTRTRTLLAQAKTIAEIVSVESELSKREAELASLQAKKRRLADLTALSTITVSLLGPDAAVAEDDEEATGFWAGIKTGWRSFLISMNVVLTVLGALLPWLLALGLPAYAVYWLNRRLRRTQPAPSAGGGEAP